MEQLKKKFDELYNFIISSRDTGKMKMLGWVMKAMMYDTIDAHPQHADEYLAILESVKWDNYLTEKEAETIVNAMSPAPKWTRQQWLKYMEQSGEGMEHYPCYNKCALYVTMCMVDSDDGETIASMMGKGGVATNDMDYFAMVHQFALNKLKDEDGVFNIRRYFKDVLWPEKNQSR
jgi:hypothetical protein